jgi:hypothetical protein
MMSCIFLFYITVLGGLRPPVETLARPFAAGGSATAGLQAIAPVAAIPDPDALYAKRDDLQSARQAAEIWGDRLQRNRKDFEAAWKLARVRYWLGGHAAASERKAVLEAGIAAARAAAALEPRRPEGHFWLAANMGALAESFGLRQGLKYRGPIRDALLVVLKLDPGYQQGSADRALGRWYFKVPALFGGSSKKSEEHLRRSLTYGPQSTISHFFLAETLLGMDRKTEAMQELQQVVDVPGDPEWAPEDREYKAKAQRLLGTLRQGKH